MGLYPVGLSEMLMYSTVLIKTNKGTGTGFFYEFKFDDKRVPVIITNKHVINNNPNERTFISFHTGVNESKTVDDKSIEIVLDVNWYLHPTHDLCFTPLMPIYDHIEKNMGKRIFYRILDESITWNEDKLKDLEAVESVLMVGYPIGLWDQENNLPLFRKGITASHPALNFNKKGIGVVDIACFPGSSGSPIFIYNEGIYVDKPSNRTTVGGRFIFLGILYAGPQMNAQGKINIVEIPTASIALSETPLMINLGYYVKASELIVFKDMLAKMLAPKTNLSEKTDIIDDNTQGNE